MQGQIRLKLIRPGRPVAESGRRQSVPVVGAEARDDFVPAGRSAISSIDLKLYV